MKWLTIDWALAASNPDTALHGARSVLCVALSYAGPPAFMTPPGNGRVARYAAGIDYHHLLEEKLNTLSETITALHANARVFVDTAPTMDKALAVRAGLGWQGRNTNILSSHLGSFTFLGGVVTDLQLIADEPANRAAAHVEPAWPPVPPER